MRIRQVSFPGRCSTTLRSFNARLLGHIYRHLAGPKGRLPSAWVARQGERLDRSDGDIDTMMTRIAHIRTLTYIAHRPDWLADAVQWQERARTIEDRLSDALHDRMRDADGLLYHFI